MNKLEKDHIVSSELRSIFAASLRLKAFEDRLRKDFEECILNRFIYIDRLRESCDDDCLFGIDDKTLQDEIKRWKINLKQCADMEKSLINGMEWYLFLMRLRESNHS